MNFDAHWQQMLKSEQPGPILISDQEFLDWADLLTDKYGIPFPIDCSEDEHDDEQ
jgi:hypothetical protein